VFGERPLRDEVKLPVPEPSLVLVLKEIVGFVLVDHTTPLFVMDVPLSAVILPPDVAEVAVIAVKAMVVSLETMEFVSFKQRTENP
jgi:hypothetical protein